MMRMHSRRDGGSVLCAGRNVWVDIEQCYRCPAFRNVRSSRVECAMSRERAYNPCASVPRSPGSPGDFPGM